MTDNSYEGFLTTYYENGNLEKKIYYKNHRKTGLSEEYYSNGNLDTRYYLLNGRYEGLYERYYLSGQLQRKYVYKNGLKNGPYIEYHPNGELLRYGVFRMDVELFGKEAEIYLEQWKKEMAEKKERQNLCQYLNMLDKRMAPTELRQQIKRQAISRFRQIYSKTRTVE